MRNASQVQIPKKTKEKQKEFLGLNSTCVPQVEFLAFCKSNFFFVLSGAMKRTYSSGECVICLDEPSSIIFNPCRHKCVCEACSKMIKQAELTCPICRAIITVVMDDNAVTLITKEEWDAFQKNKKEYTGKFRIRGNAFFVGSNSKKAKEIAKTACSELEQRYLERRGSEMCMSKQKKVEEKDGRLFVSYNKPDLRNASWV